jgi:hypothetical protein
MIAHSYLIFSPSEPTDVSAAVMQQRQSIPLAWAFAFSSPSTQLKSDGSSHYFLTHAGDAVTALERGIAAWAYNDYLRDTLAPVKILRDYIADYSPDTLMYLNITELISESPSPEADLAELKRLPEKVNDAFEEIEDKNLSVFMQKLRKLSYPLVTVPITGDREVDLQILRYEIRDTSSMEAEIALQMIGVDRDKSRLRQAVEAIKLQSRPAAAGDPATVEPLALFTGDIDTARALLVGELGLKEVQGDDGRLLLQAGNRTVMLIALGEHHQPST